MWEMLMESDGKERQSSSPSCTGMLPGPLRQPFHQNPASFPADPYPAFVT